MSIIIIYLGFIIVFLGFSAAGIYHLWRFGYTGDLTHKIILIYSFFSLLIIGVSFAFIVPMLSQLNG